MARRFLQNAGEVSIHLKGDLPLIWRMIHTTWRNGRTVVISAILCGGIPAFAAMIQEQTHVAPAHDVAQDLLEDRVSSAPESLLKRFSNELNVNVSAHIVTPGERITLANALAQLTPFQHGVLLNRLHAIYFIDGLPGNALTFSDGGPTAKPKFNIAVRAGALHETVSELVTRKERTLFDSAGSELSLRLMLGLSMLWSMFWYTRQPILWILRSARRLIPHIQVGIIHL